MNFSKNLSKMLEYLFSFLPMRKVEKKATTKKVAKNKKTKKRKGLTLIELAIVILVLGVIMAIVYSNLNPTEQIQNAKRLQIKSTATTLEANLTRYELENGALADGSKLTALTQKTGTWAGLKEDQVLDPWKKPYHICSDNSGNRNICSYGSDGVPGGKGEAEDFYLTDQNSWPSWLKAKK